MGIGRIDAAIKISGVHDCRPILLACFFVKVQRNAQRFAQIFFLNGIPGLQNIRADFVGTPFTT